MSKGIQPSAENDLAEVFKAARTLLAAGTKEPEIIIPTLAFAHCVGLGWGECVAAKKPLIDAWNSSSWDQATVHFNKFYMTCVPIEVVEGVPFIRRAPISVSAILGTRENGVPSQAFIDIYQTSEVVDESVVAEAYRDALLTEGISWEEGCSRAVTTHEFLDGSLHIMAASTVLSGYPQISLLALGENQQEWIDVPELPSPEWIKLYCNALKSTSEFKNKVRGRTGPSAMPENLIPAYVAYSLETYQKKNKEIHELLNERILCDHWKTLPEYEPNSSATKQLNRVVKNYRGRFEAAFYSFTLYFPPYLAYEE